MKVKLLDYTRNGEELITASAKLCYSNKEVDELLETLRVKDPEETIKFISMLSDIGHGSPFEHAKMTFAIEGVSRSLTHQLVRHRIASYSQQSQRYVNMVDFDFVVPDRIKNNDWIMDEYLKIMHQIKEFMMKAHEELIMDEMEDISKYGDIAGQFLQDCDNGVFDFKTERLFDYFKDHHKSDFKKVEKMVNEDIRYILPNATTSKIIVTMNLRSLQAFFKLRMCDRSQWEIREMAHQMWKLAFEKYPTIFEKSGKPCWSGACPEGSMTCGNASRYRHEHQAWLKGVVEDEEV